MITFFFWMVLFFSMPNEMCFFSHEKDAGMNKICFYDCPSGDVAITISAVELCPMTINR